MSQYPEYKTKCCECKSKGTETHARVFFRKIKGVWKYLCKTCWNERLNKIKI